MARKIYALYFCLLFILPAVAVAQTDWQVKLDKEGIKVYTKYTDNSKYKAVKTVCTLDASLSTITAVLLDVNAAVNWVYSTKSSKLLKTISASELIYHSEINVPWPFNNRDFVVQLKVLQDAKTKAVVISGENLPAYSAQTKDVVRIQYSYSKWVIEPLPGGKVKVEFELQTDPGGNIPAWLINMFATKGPFESFKKLKEEIKKPLYSKAVLPFIKN